MNKTKLNKHLCLSLVLVCSYLFPDVFNYPFQVGSLWNPSSCSLDFVDLNFHFPTALGAFPGQWIFFVEKPKPTYIKTENCFDNYYICSSQYPWCKTISKPSSKGSNSLFWPPRALHTHTCRQNTSTLNHSKNQSWPAGLLSRWKCCLLPKVWCPGSVFITHDRKREKRKQKPTILKEGFCYTEALAQGLDPAGLYHWGISLALWNY